MPSTLPLHAELKTLDLTEPFRIAHGTSSMRQVLRVSWGDAVGEAPFVPYYGEDSEATLSWVQSLEWKGDPAPSEGPRAGLLALDVLWHDAIGKERGVSVGSLLGQTPKVGQAACRSFSIPTDLEAYDAKVRETVRQFHVLKLKLGGGNTDLDEAIVAVAREAAPRAQIFVDVNGGWSVEEAARLIPKIARYNLALVEQPIHHKGGIEAWRELRAALPSCPVPLYADESAQNAEDATLLAGLVEGVNVKLLKCGSIAAAARMMRMARAHDLGILLGCMIESSIGVTAAAHLAPLADWVDLDGHLYVANDDFDGVRFDADGNVVMPERSGLGVVGR